jgi:hypothetical protein
MIDESKVKNLSSGSNPSESPRFQWAHMPQETLLQYLDEIKAVLNSTSLVEMNMEEELVLQYRAVKALQGRVIDDLETPANQRAQVANAVASSLTRLADLQMTIYTSERFKRVETLLIRHLSKMPEDVAAQFLDDYESMIKKHG